MSHTAEHYLGIYSIRLEMQDKGVTNPSDSVKAFTRRFVKRLRELDSSTQIDCVQAGGDCSFVLKSTGEVLAQLAD